MNAAQQSKELNTVKLSIGGALFMAVLGFTFAVLTKSDAIFMDGAFSLVNLVVGYFTLQVTRLVQRPEDEDFQFGYAHFEPMLNVFKGLMTLVICVVACLAAFNSISQGGRELTPGLPIVYAIVAAIGCFGLALLIRHRAKQLHSEILGVEWKAWMIDGAVSGVVALAFVGMDLLKQSPWAEYSNYVDPGLMIALTILLLPIPLKIARDNLLELLWIAPERSIQLEIRKALEQWTLNNDPIDHSLHMVKIGRALYVEVRLLLPDNLAETPLRQLDVLRSELDEAVKTVSPGAMCTIQFTIEPELVR